MNNAINLIKVVSILSIALLAVGCSSINTAMNNLKYGKLYTMQEALELAATACDNESAMRDAVNWAIIGYDDLEKSYKYMDRQSVQYVETRNMMRILAPISARRVDNTRLCRNITIAARQGREYLANIDNDTPIAKPSVVLAAVRH